MKLISNTIKNVERTTCYLLRQDVSIECRYYFKNKYNTNMFHTMGTIINHILDQTTDQSTQKRNQSPLLDVPQTKINQPQTHRNIP